MGLHFSCWYSGDLVKIDGIMNKKMHSDFDPLCNNTSRKLLTGFIFPPDNESTHTVMAVKAYLDPRPFAVCPFLSSHFPILTAPLSNKGKSVKQNFLKKFPQETSLKNKGGHAKY